MKKSIVIICGCMMILAAACSKSGTTGGGSGGGTTLDCTIVPKSFSTDVNPTVQATCNSGGCHASGSLNGPGPITNYSQVFAARTSIRAAVAAGTMPQGSTLSGSQKNSILCWIDSGAPNN